jgi:RHS repeat-associated protein
MLTDRLGSVDGIADSAGNLIETRGFDAFGKPRTGTWGDATPPRLTSTATTRHGFTGHEHLDSLQLIHMNGRVYDYNIGRFMGVDPVIQSPLNSQSLNPYSYILNNPLSGTDPTGYVCEAMTGTHLCGVDTGAENGKAVKSQAFTGPSGDKTVVKTTIYSNGPTIMHVSRPNNGASDAQNGKTKNQANETNGVRPNKDELNSNGVFAKGQYAGTAPLRGSYYFGGAGMDGGYIDDTVKTLNDAGITDAAAASSAQFSNGTKTDAAIGVQAMVNNLPDYNVNLTQSEAGKGSNQFNLIGYSYGSLVGAQVADEYVKSGGVVNNLVLIGSPIGKAFLNDLFDQRNIQNTLIINLRNRGDYIYAGMSQSRLNAITVPLAFQMLQHRGHFYYQPSTEEGHARRQALANALYSEGLR